MLRLSGTVAGSGIAIGPARLLPPRIDIEERHIASNRLLAELDRFEHAVATTDARMAEVGHPTEAASEVGAELVGVHRSILRSDELVDETRRLIRERSLGAEWAVRLVVKQMGVVFADMKDERFRERFSDVEQVADRLLRTLLELPELRLDERMAGAIAVGFELSPVDALQMHRLGIAGFAAERGGPTSHTAILARALGIPAIVGIGHGLWQVEDGATVTLDGDQGILDIAPGAEAIARFHELHAEHQHRQAGERKAAQAPATTADGQRIEVLANIAAPQMCAEALAWGAEGVGLFRTEFLFLNRNDPPTEAEQYVAYREVIEALGGRRCLIRTADIGGDKEVPYLAIEQEANPFLGWRGTRLLWGMESLLRTQLRALLRASAHGPIGIMFPMIAGVADMRAARRLLESVRDELLNMGEPIGDPAVGIMIELPSAALCAEHLARECDFFSIGTNDLTQYTLACDRTNPRVAHLLDSFHPAVLELIARTIEAGQRAGIHVGMCGEMAADLAAAPILLGLGLPEFSASPAAIPALKRRIGALTTAQAREIAMVVRGLASAEEVRATLAGTLEATDAGRAVMLGHPIS